MENIQKWRFWFWHFWKRSNFEAYHPQNWKNFQQNFKGRLCVHRGIVWYHFQYGFGGGAYSPSPLWIMGRENRPWTTGLRSYFRPPYTLNPGVLAYPTAVSFYSSQGYLLCKILWSGLGGWPLENNNLKWRFRGKKESRKRKTGETYIENGEKGLKNASFWVINSKIFRTAPSPGVGVEGGMIEMHNIYQFLFSLL